MGNKISVLVLQWFAVKPRQSITEQIAKTKQIAQICFSVFGSELEDRNIWLKIVFKI